MKTCYLCLVQKLAGHIERLLSENDLVILPGFGALVAQRSGCRREGAWLLPPSKQLSFNPSVRHDDGTLAASYMCTGACSYEQAGRMAADDLRAFTGLLDSGRSVKLDRIGIFRKEEGRIRFEPDRRGFPVPESYGLKPVCFSALDQDQPTAERPVEPAEQPAPVIDLAPRRRTAYSVIAVAATLLLLLLPTGLDRSSIRLETAGWTPRSLEVEPLDTLLQAEALPEDETEEEEPATPYHLIIGSFKTRRQAVKMMQTVPTGWQPYLIYADERYRIAIASFETESESGDYLERFTAAQPAYRDAWILTLNTEP